MSHLRTILVTLTLFGVAVIPMTGGVATPETGCLPGDSFENEHVRIWFHGAKGFVKVFRKDNETGGNIGMYQYKTGSLVEADANGTRASMNLERAFPQTSMCEVVDDGETVVMRLTVTDTVRGEDGAVGDATVTFVYRFNKTSDGAKFDLLVDAWPWQAGDSTLAYLFDVTVGDGTIEPAANGVGFRDEDGEAIGSIEWAPNATAEYEDGHNETAIVASEVTMEDANATHAEVRLEFTNVTSGYSFLDYDPWVGTGWFIVIGGLLVTATAVPEPVRSLVDPVLRRIL